MKTSLPSIILGVGVLVIWEIGTLILSVPQYLLPRPSQILTDLFTNFYLLATNAGITLAEAIAGFIIANTSALFLSILMIYVRHLDRALMPFAIALKTTPIVAMAPLLILWLGTGIAPKIAAAALISFFPALVNSLKGLNSLLDGEEDLFNVYGASKTQVLMKLRLQRAAPYIFSALKVSSSLAIVGAIVGEFVGANRGIGYLILVSSYHLETVRMFSALAMAAIAGTALYALISYFDKKIVFWIAGPMDEVRLDSPPGRAVSIK